MSYVLVKLIDALHNAKVKGNYVGLKETLIGRFSFQVFSFLHLAKGIKIEKKGKLIDVGTLFLLNRSLMENYLTYIYLFNEEIEIEQREYRINIFQLSGLISKKKYQDLFENLSKTKLEDQINEFKDKIKISKYFKSEKTKYKKKDIGWV